MEERASDKIMRRYNVGYPILVQISKLDKDELRTLLTSIFTNESRILQLLNLDFDVTMIVKNYRVDEISLSYYDSIIIDWMGIYLKLEHGSKNLLVEFNEHFKI